MTDANDNEDPFDAFGSSSSDDDDDNSDENDHGCGEKEKESSAIASTVCACVAQHLLQTFVGQPLYQRKVLLLTPSTGVDTLIQWKDALYGKQINGITVCTELQLVNLASNIVATTADRAVAANEDESSQFDAILWLNNNTPRKQIGSGDEATITVLQAIQLMLIPGGCLVFHSSTVSDLNAFDKYIWQGQFGPTNSLASGTFTKEGEYWNVMRRWPARIATTTCPWLRQQYHDTAKEQSLLSAATLPLSVHERTTSRLSDRSIQRAVISMQSHGYCILPGLFQTRSTEIQTLADAVLQDLHAAATILRDCHGVDVYQPAAVNNNDNNNSTSQPQEPGSYQELSMREDYRMDVRFGPSMTKVRHDQMGPTGNESIRCSASTSVYNNEWLRGHASLLDVVRRVMNPTLSRELSGGNFGRYNFSGSGPDGSYQDVSVGVVGGIVSLPGAADQAIHADTPHLFEHSTEPLPAHYINVFVPGCTADDRVGQTAFVHGSHRLDFCARHVNQASPTTNDNNGDENVGVESLEAFRPTVWEFLVRPRLDVGDCVLFDCRMLHFGLANTHETIERPLLYANMTMHWFHDPKNWDQHAQIFGDADSSED